MINSLKDVVFSIVHHFFLVLYSISYASICFLDVSV